MKRFACVVLLVLLGCVSAEGQTLQVVSVTLTHEQIKALPSSSIELVAAPAIGRVIRVFAMSASVKTEAAYGNIDPDGYISIGTPIVNALYVAFNEAGGTAAPFLTAILGNPSHPHYYLMGSAPGQFHFQGWGIVPNPRQQAWVSGQPLVLQAWNGLGDFTGGDPSDTLKITVYYTLEDL